MLLVEVFALTRGRFLVFTFSSMGNAIINNKNMETNTKWSGNVLVICKRILF